MTLFEKKKDQLMALVTEISSSPTKIAVHQLLYMLRMRCQILAEIVHLGQVDKAGKPYSHHVKRVAAKTNSLALFCALILHDVIEEGKELNITLEFLKNEMRLPDVIVEIVECLTRGEIESYPEYVKRIMTNYLAQKGKVLDNADNADITRFDNPNRSDVLRCTRYLEKAQYIKSNPSFQENQKYDMFHDMVSLHRVIPLAHDYTDRIVTEEKIEQAYYFGYEEQMDRSYVIHFDATIDKETGKTTAVINTYPSRDDLATWNVWKPRRQIVEFESSFAAQEFLHNCGVLLNSNEFLVIRECLEAFRNPTSQSVQTETIFDLKIDKYYQ